MGFRVARKHATTLRRLALATGLILPAVLIVLAWLAAGTVATVLMAVAAASSALGIVSERWLFFAEARHTVVNYYEGVR